MKNKAIIVTGGSLNEKFVLSVLAKEDGFLIGVDRGLKFLFKHKIKVDLIVGDFDSVRKEIVEYYKNNTQVPIREFNPEKDATDTEIALKQAIDLGYQEILILGATGTRMDHTWANVQILRIAQKANAKAVILDPFNKISLLESPCILKKEEAYGPNFSLFSMGECLEKLTISGAKYPLEDYKLEPYDSLCVSNEFEEDKVHIRFERGIGILMETKDTELW